MSKSTALITAELIFEELRDAVSSIGHPLARTERAGRVQ